MDVKDAISKFSGGLAESLCKHEFFLLSISLLLYIDCAVNIYFRKNIITFSWESFLFSDCISSVAILVVVYSAFVSCILPALNYTIIVLIDSFPKNSRTRPYYNFHTMVSRSKALELAEFSGNNVLYEKCKHYDTIQNKCRIISNYSFYVIFFIFLDYAFLGDSKNPTLLQGVGDVHSYFYSIIMNSVSQSSFGPIVAAILSRVMVFMCIVVACFIFFMWKNNSFIDESEYFIDNGLLAKVINADSIEREKKEREKHFT